MTDEIWKDVIGYEGLYQVSNLGRVKSLDRTIRCQDKNGSCYFRSFKGQILTQHYYLKYKGVGLSVNQKPKNFLVHRLVAQAFIPNPDNLPQVNHKDEDPSNNCVDNLEWCSASYNVNYGSRNEIVSKTLKGRSKSPEQVEQMRQRMIGNVPWNKGVQSVPIVCLDANITFAGSRDAAAWVGKVGPAAVEYAAKHVACCQGHVFVYADNIPKDKQKYIDLCYTHSSRYKHLASQPVYSL